MLVLHRCRDTACFLCAQELAGRLERGGEEMFDELPALASGAASTASRAGSELAAATIRLSAQHKPIQLKQLMKRLTSS
jgi:hypothetical protein